MYAAALRAEIRLPDTHSLKEKRRKMRALFNMLSTTFPVAVSEVDHQDLWQRTTIGVAAVAPQASQLERLLRSVERSLHRHHGIEVLEVAVSHMERPE